MHFRPKLIKVALETKDKYDSAVEFYAVSCAAMTELCQKYKINAYPSVFAVREGNVNSVDDLTNINAAKFSLVEVEKALNLDDSPLQTEQSRQLGEPESQGEDFDARREKTVTDQNNIESGKNEEESENGNVIAGDKDENEDDEPNADAGSDDDQNESREDDDEEESNEEEEEPEDEEEEEEEELRLETEAPERSDNLGPGPGALAAKSKMRSMDKWKEIQKQRLREHEYLMLKRGQARAGDLGEDFIKDQEGATTAMKANRHGTVEYNARQKKMLQVLKKMKQGKRKREVELQQMVNAGKIPFRKQITTPRLSERIPMVQRFVRMSTEETLILDASMSFLEGLRIGVFKSMEPLSPAKKAALHDWLGLLRIALPSEWALHDTITDLLDNFDLISGNPKGLTLILERHRFPRKKWSKECTASGNSWTCGFWKLLHIMTVGVAEHRGGVDLVTNGSVPKGTKTFSPLEAADTLRKYMEFFFLCSECSANFINHYDNCENNRRCDRLVVEASSASDADWKELANWLWEAHNEINVRILNEKADDVRKKARLFRKVEAGPGSASMADEIQVLWPTIDGCIACFNADGSYNEGKIFQHLEQIYW